MPKFRVTVTYTPPATVREVEIEAESENAAEQLACFGAKWLGGRMSVDMFADAGFSCETEEVTFECSECGREFPIAERVNDWCGPCDAKIAAEHQEQIRTQHSRRAGAMEE